MVKNVINFSKFINTVSKARKPSAIRKTTELILNGPPTLISLAGGMPNPTLFPFESFDIKIANGGSVSISGNELSKALQYCASPGSPILRKWILQIHEKYHNPPLLSQKDGPKFGYCVTSGSQDGLSRAFEMLLNDGDSLLLDNPCYTGTLALLRPKPVKLIPVETDKYGMTSISLEKCLSPYNRDDPARPKVIYTIPNCSNPTGVSASKERKQEIYQIAQEYDLVLIEDDPYYFLQFGDNIAPSYQQLDTDGRVLRCDSLSKVLSAGMRIGWISGAEEFINRIILHVQASSLHASSVTQTIAGKLFDQWKLEEFAHHVTQISKFYKSQRDAMLTSCDKWLTGLAEWNIPEGGMFLWIKVNGVTDTTKMIEEKAIAKDVALLPGSVFEVVDGTPSPYVRAAFSISTPEQIDIAIQRFAEVIKEETGF